MFRAPWIVPVSSPVIADGAVVVDQDTIIAVGPFSDVFSTFPDLPLTNCSGVLLPALVNAHIHLDLSAYGTIFQETESSTMCDWITKLLQKREDANLSDIFLKNAAKKIVQDQYDSGVGLLLDINNTSLGSFDFCPVEIISLSEMLGPSKLSTEAVKSAIQKLPSNQSVTGHAPYSTSPELLRFIKTRCHNNNQLFSLHLAENPDEALLLSEGRGCFSQFLKERGGWDDTFPVHGIDSKGVVGYLHDLGILDERTVCVHCVHVTDAEIRIISDSGAHVCLCPASNKFLSVGTAPLEQLLQNSILPALGTDSIASNPNLDMWEEMALLRESHPDVSPAIIFSIATLGGALAMHYEESYGSLAPGRKSCILHIQDSCYEELGSPEQLLDQLTSHGRPDSIIRLRV